MRKLDYPFFIGTVKNEEGMFYVADNFAKLFSKEEMIELANGIKKFIKKYGDEIDNINRERERKHQEEYQQWKAQQKAEKEEKPRKNGKIYIMECNGKYKVGMSTFVENRLKQLDNRPFPCQIVFKSSDTKYAYEIEQEIHLRLFKKRIKGEWYEMTDELVKRVSDDIEYLIEQYNAEIFKPSRLKELRSEFDES